MLARMMLLASLCVLVAAVITLLAANRRVRQVKSALSKVEGEALKRAGRIRALVEIASVDIDDEWLATVLQIATAAMRPGKPMFGVFTHLEGETMVTDSAAFTAAAESRLSETHYPGATFQYRRTIQSLLTGKTQAWNDLSFLRGSGMLAEELGVRSVIGTPVIVGRHTYFLMFASFEPMGAESFEEDDIAYVDAVAAQFAHHFIQQQQFERIQFQIEHDALTGIENRVQFRKRLRDHIRERRPVAVAFIDLDDFREINNRVGHQIADEVLVEVAAGLAGICPEHSVARLSGDEFGVLLAGIEQLECVEAALKPYAEIFAKPFHTGDRAGTRMLSVRASIGVARFPADGTTAENVMRRANVALDLAKARGGSTVLVFHSSMEAVLEQTRFRVDELALAIAHGQLAIAYQPTVDLATRAIVGAEALVRWNHPERGQLMPADFVHFAEGNRLLAPLSRWVLGRVTRDIERGALPAGFRRYFNHGAQALDDLPFIEELIDQLSAAPLLAEHLGIEVTETAAMHNVEQSTRTIDRLRRMGLSVAIDDFGTGYSSLSYLKHLAVDTIKIDRSFVRGLPDDVRDAALTEVLLRITQSFGAKTLAEGIETEDQVAWLVQHDCRLGQGFLFAKPDSFEALLEALRLSSIEKPRRSGV